MELREKLHKIMQPDRSVSYMIRVIYAIAGEEGIEI